MIISSANDYREAAKRRLPPFLFHYIDGGAYAAENAIQDGSWVRLRDIGVSYRYKLKSNKASLSSIDIGYTGRNLWLKTAYKGVDPETSLTGGSSNIGGFDYFNNPGTKGHVVSLKLAYGN